MGLRVLGWGGLPRRKASSIVPRPVSQSGFAMCVVVLAEISFEVREVQVLRRPLYSGHRN